MLRFTAEVIRSYSQLVHSRLFQVINCIPRMCHLCNILSLNILTIRIISKTDSFLGRSINNFLIQFFAKQYPPIHLWSQQIILWYHRARGLLFIIPSNLAFTSRSFLVVEYHISWEYRKFPLYFNVLTNRTNSKFGLSLLASSTPLLRFNSKIRSQINRQIQIR